MWKKIILYSLIAVVAIFLLAQLLPFGKDHSNPPVIQEPNWDSPQTAELARRACYDCHNNETVWPWYSKVATVSWLVVHDTQEGRSKLNFSEWGLPHSGESGEENEGREGGEGAEDAAETVLEGSMPLRQYLLTHPEARLSTAEKQALAAGLANSLR